MVIEEARLQPIQNLQYNLQLKNPQNPENVTP